MSGLPPRGVEHHPDGQAGPVLAGPEAAQACGQAFGQHGFHTVREVDAVALLPGGPVEGRAGPDIGRDVGDGDPDDPAAGVRGVAVRLGEDGVVVVAGVRRVDGDEGDVAQVLAARKAGLARRVGFRLRRLGKARRDAVGVDGDQGGGAGIILAPHPLQDLAPVQAEAPRAGGQPRHHQVAVAKVRRAGALDQDLVP